MSVVFPPLQRRVCFLLSLLVLLTASLPAAAQGPSLDEPAAELAQSPERPAVGPPVTLPRPIFGIETLPNRLQRSAIERNARVLGTTWVRINAVSWRDVQEQPNTPPDSWNWEALESFEQDVLAANRTGHTPMIIVDDSPDWATIIPGNACSAILPEYHDDYATFLGELVSRYSQEPYNVRYWELGNEPDVDPRLVDEDNLFGCWGDIDDPFYGGELYGEMLKVVYPAIKAADPQAQLLNGGLLLDRPDTNVANRGKPERFLEGILRAGAGDSFDMLAFHSYPFFRGRGEDTDLTDSRWAALGGMTLGKAAFLREVMARYGVDKPLFLNEAALLSRTRDDTFFLGQADHIVRVSLRAMSAGIEGYLWYTLRENGWLSGGLTNERNELRAPYPAYQELIDQVGDTLTITPLDSYGAGVEAYRFGKAGYLLDVLWSVDNEPDTVRLPRTEFAAAFDLNGSPLEPTLTDTEATLAVGFSPIYLHRLPAGSQVPPRVEAVTPAEGRATTATSLVISGSNFQPGATVRVGDTLLDTVRVVNTTRLEATVPPGLPAGATNLTVGNRSGQASTLVAAFSVLAADTPTVAEVRPVVGLTDQPVVLHIYGTNFAATVGARLGDSALNVTRLSATHLQATLPGDTLAEGTYNLTVTNPDQPPATLPNAYTVLAAGSSQNDVYGYAYGLITNPVTVRAGETFGVRQRIYRAGSAAVDEGSVRFARDRQGIGNRPFTLAANARTTLSNSLNTTLDVPGSYTITARISAPNLPAEVSTANNIITRTVQVLSATVDTDPPTIDTFVINNGAATTNERTVDITLVASERGARTGVASVFLVEYAYSPAAQQWLPVQQPPSWMPYSTGQMARWTLTPEPGLRVIQAWVADRAGNVSRSAQMWINALPNEKMLVPGQTHIYRSWLTAGDVLGIALTPSSGTVDFYIWGPDNEQPLAASGRSSQPQDLTVLANETGLYQIEIGAASASSYALALTRNPVAQASSTPTLAQGSLRNAPLLTRTNTPPTTLGLPAAPQQLIQRDETVYVPVVRR